MPVDPWGFTKTPRQDMPKRPVELRLRDFDPVYARQQEDVVRAQASRCMGCGVPFCHQGCPLGNLIPEWNELVLDADWRRAIDRLHATNNFPEFTGWLCPAPCEAACVLAISDDPVSIKQIELSIIDKAWDSGWVVPLPPERMTSHTAAVVGSGPAGLAAAQQLTRVGWTVVVYERSDEVGGLLRYGIPDFKMPKRAIDRRVEQMKAEGTRFVTGVEVGSEAMPVSRLRRQFDAVGARRRARWPRASSTSRAAGSTASSRPWTSCPRPTATWPARPSRSGSPRRASTSWSSAAATPRRTAWARPTARAPPRSPCSTTTPPRPWCATRSRTRGRSGTGCTARARPTRRASSSPGPPRRSVSSATTRAA